VGSDKLYQEPESLQHFEIWLRQMAFYLKGNEKKCAYVLGHASITRYDVGQKEKNCGLSKKRAISVKDRIQQVSSNVDWRLRAVGKGSDECIKCTVPDSEENIIDRRVEFKVVACDSDIWKLRQEKECLVE